MTADKVTNEHEQNVRLKSDVHCTDDKYEMPNYKRSVKHMNERALVDRYKRYKRMKLSHTSQTPK